MSFKKDVTYEYASQCLAYCPHTGAITRKFRPREHFETEKGWKISNKWAGKEAGTKVVGDYRYVKIDGSMYAVHRLAFLLMNGSFPDNEVDHINGNKSDNSWSNLRVCNRIQQNQNIKVKNTSASGIKGVFFNKRANLWFSTIRHNGKRIHLGYFKTKEECAAAYAKAAIDFHGEFVNLG